MQLFEYKEDDLNNINTKTPTLKKVPKYSKTSWHFLPMFQYLFMPKLNQVQMFVKLKVNKKRYQMITLAPLLILIVKVKVSGWFLIHLKLTHILYVKFVFDCNVFHCYFWQLIYVKNYTFTMIFTTKHL